MQKSSESLKQNREVKETLAMRCGWDGLNHSFKSRLNSYSLNSDRTCEDDIQDLKKDNCFFHADDKCIHKLLTDATMFYSNTIDLTMHTTYIFENSTINLVSKIAF